MRHDSADVNGIEKTRVLMELIKVPLYFASRYFAIAKQKTLSF